MQFTPVQKKYAIYVHRINHFAWNNQIDLHCKQMNEMRQNKTSPAAAKTMHKTKNSWNSTDLMVIQ